MLPKTMHELEMHEIIFWGSVSILRVPGGWIYCFNRNTQNEQYVFVPYTDEFRTSECNNCNGTGTDTNHCFCHNPCEKCNATGRVKYEGGRHGICILFGFQIRRI